MTVKDKPTAPAAVAKGRAPKVNAKSADARKRALEAAGVSAVPDPAEPKPTPSATAAPASLKKDA